MRREPLHRRLGRPRASCPGDRGRCRAGAAGADAVGAGRMPACVFGGPSNLVDREPGERGGGGDQHLQRDVRRRRGPARLRAAARLGRDAPRPRCSRRRRQEAEALFRRIGITFAVYGEGGDTERLIPFDMMPRVFTEAEWRRLERGREAAGAGAQRLPLRRLPPRRDHRAPGSIPADLVFRNEAYEPAVVGIDPPGGVYSPHRRHRPGAHRARGLLRARGQLPHAVGRLLHAREPRDHDADVPRAVPRAAASRRSTTIPSGCAGRWRASRRRSARASRSA